MGLRTKEARMKGEILVVDDDPMVCRTLVQLIQARGESAVGVGSGEEALRRLASRPCRLVFADVQLPGMSGLALLREIRARYAGTPVVLVSGHGCVETAVQAMQDGARDFLLKPFSAARLGEILAATLDSGAAGEGASLAGIVTQDPRMLALLRTAARAAHSAAPVLIQGESGTGKELLAREIHLRSPRRDQPFIALNCAAVPEALLESELFGHERGAFTGAVARRRGKFEAAHQGTLLLDEVSETTPQFQAKLLRALQEGELDRVGRDCPVRVDVRVVATTNRSLREELQAGRFRQDLFFRLNVIPLRIPPLRERPADIPLLARHFLAKHRPAGSPVQDIGEAALARLMGYTWPGNVRELESTVQRSLLLCSAPILQPAHLQLETGWLAPAAETGTRSEVERRLILATLERVGGNRSRAADALGVSVRTIRNRLRQYRQEAALPAAAQA
ncbi:MAG: sigma-54-dependent transcriptional regulator [Candidatus Methylomirabilales bacterium]